MARIATRSRGRASCHALPGRPPVRDGADGGSSPSPVAHAAVSRARTRRAKVLALLALDAAALLLTTALAYLARQSLPWFSRANDLNDALVVSGWVVGLGWILAIAWSGGYSPRLLPTGPEIYRNVLHAFLGAAGICSVILFLGTISLSRVFFVAYFVIGLVLLLLNRLVARRALNSARAHGRFQSRTLIVGAMPSVDELTRTLRRERWLGYDVIGAVIPRADPRTTSAEGIDILGFEEDLAAVIRDEIPAVVLFTAGSSHSTEEFRRIAWELEELDLDVIVVPALSEISSDRVTMRPVAGLPLVHMDLPRSRDALKWSKRLFDIVGSATLLVVCAPILLGCAVAVKAADGGPVIFRQKRVGRGGQEFGFLKLRSMVVDAETKLTALRGDEQDRGNAVLFKMAEDPRITRPGRFLRRYSLDELPQLWNVLRGEMSLVGPRPALPSEVSEYDSDASRRLAVRPGITGLWQVSGRSDLSWDETVRLDLFYVDNWSFTQDIQILARTVKAVLAPSGAY